MRRLVGLLTATLIVLLATQVDAVRAQTTRSVEWERYDVALELHRDGSLSVEERQTIRFQGTFREGYRAVPLDRTTGLIQVGVAEVRGGQEVAYSQGSERAGTFATGREPDGLGVSWWFEPTSAGETRTFVVRYTAQGATRVYADTAQVWWKAIYAARDGPVDTSTVTLRLPAAVPADELISTAYVYNGRPRELGSGRLVDPSTLSFSIGELRSGEGAEVRAQIPRTLVPQATPPPWQADADRGDWIEQSLAPIATFLVLLLSIAILFGGGVAIFMLWYSRGREPEIGSVPQMLADPPSQLPAPLAGTLVDGVADLQDAVATLVDLAQRGVLSLKHEGGDVRVSLHAPSEADELRPYERVLLVALFGRGVAEGESMLSAARTRFAAAVPVLEERLYEAIAHEGLFVSNPEKTRRRYAALGWGMLVGGVALAVIAAMLLGWAVPIVWLPGVAAAIIGVALVLVARAMPRRTPRGALEAARWQAFRRHLVADEPDDVAEGYLPYAVAFGIDRDFLKRLEPVTATASDFRRRRHHGGAVFVPGGWYGGGGGGRNGSGPSSSESSTGVAGPQGWSDALADLLNSASEAMSHGGGSGRWSGGGWGGGGGGGGGRGGFR
jgi:hypothetical protein